MAARDGRMAVLNELIGAVRLSPSTLSFPCLDARIRAYQIKFIKFFAWEDKWISRALDARNVEIKWLIKSRLNTVMFYLLWTLAPILVSIISFFAYVMQGKELSVSIAFTVRPIMSSRDVKTDCGYHQVDRVVQYDQDAIERYPGVDSPSSSGSFFLVLVVQFSHLSCHSGWRLIEADSCLS